MRQLLSDVVGFAGLSAITTGAMLFDVAVGLVVGGVAALYVSWRMGRA